MTFRPVSELNVIINIEGDARSVGKMVWSQRKRCAAFEFSNDYIRDPLPISPAKLAVGAAINIAPLSPFSGLHGVFNDSLPDGWGRRLFEKWCQKTEIDHRMPTPLDRLAAVGGSGIGALSYDPSIEIEPIQDRDLDWVVEQIELALNNDDDADIEALFAIHGSACGARPKFMIGLELESGHIVLDDGQPLRPGFQHWLVKGRCGDDHEAIGIEEHAYALMARAAGLLVADTRVLTTSEGRHLFATRRFDRTSKGRLHMHSVSGLLHDDHRYTQIGYDTLHRLTWALTRDGSEVSRMFSHMVFNVFAHNRDDHSKNHSFLMDSDGRWKLSPAYDLTFSEGIAEEHCLFIGGPNSEPVTKRLLAIARKTSIPSSEAKDIIDRVRDAVARWPKFADEAGLHRQRTTEIELALSKGGKR